MPPNLKWLTSSCFSIKIVALLTFANVVRTFASRMLNAICCFYLTFVPQKPPTSGIVKVKNCKIFSNTVTVSSYFYDGIVDYCICFLICFILSLSSVRLINSLSFLISTPSFSVNCSQHSFSLFVPVVRPPRRSVGPPLF